MYLLFRHVSVGLSLLVLAATPIAMRGPNVLQRDVPDAFEREWEAAGSWSRWLPNVTIGYDIVRPARQTACGEVTPAALDDCGKNSYYKAGRPKILQMVYSQMPHIVAIFDSNNDTIFECFSAKRTHFDPEAKEVTYVVMFKGHHGTQKKNVAFYVTAGPTPNTILFTDDEHPDVQETAEISYTNHKNCYVVDFPYLGEQCILYVSKEVVDNVPQDCIDHFEDICGVAVPEYSRDLCPDDEEDY